MKQLKPVEDFIAELTKNFPLIASEVIEDKGLLVLQVGAFTRLTQNAINAGDWEVAVRCFEFAEASMEEFEYDIDNSLIISWLGKLQIPQGSRAEALLSAKLKNTYRALHQSYANPSKNSKANDFLKNNCG